MGLGAADYLFPGFWVWARVNFSFYSLDFLLFLILFFWGGGGRLSKTWEILAMIQIRSI